MVSDLKNKKIGILLATTSQLFADRFLDKYGISRDSVEIVNLLPPAMQSAIIEGSGVDAISIWQPYVYNVEKALGDNAVTFRDKNIYTGYMNLAVQNNLLKENPQLIDKLLRAYVKATVFLKQNKEESLNILSKVLTNYFIFVQSQIFL